MNLLKSDTEVEEDEISKIDNIDSYINSLSPEEIIAKAPIFQRMCDEKIKEVQQLFSIIEEKESKLNSNLPTPLSNTQGINSYSNNINHKKSINTSSNPSTPNTNIHINNTNSSQISQKEPSCISSIVDKESLQREHNQQILELETEYKKKLEKDLELLEEEHSKEMSELRKDYEKKALSLTEEINKMKNEIEFFNENKELFITKEEHKGKILKIIEEKSKEIDTCNREIERIENEIKDQYPSLIKNNNTIDVKEIKDIGLPKLDINSIQDENFGNKVDAFMAYLKKLRESDKDFITLVSTIDKVNNKKSFITIGTEGSDYGSNDLIDFDEGMIIPKDKIVSSFKTKFIKK